MSFPNFGIDDVEDMSLKEIDARISFFNKTRFEQKSAELKSLISLLHTTISYGTSPSAKNNNKFSRFLEKTFNRKKIRKEETFDEVMNPKHEQE